MKALTGGTRLAFLLFFGSHIPITMLLDGQAAIPEFMYPQFALDLVDWYATTFGDPLMTRPFEPWFTGLVTAEVLLQLPFFFVAVRMLLTTSTNQVQYYPDWFRTACLIYGSHVSTTLLPILYVFCTHPEPSPIQRTATIAIYSPYLIFPMWLVYIAAWEKRKLE
jgi:hypothetical protein